jgi:peptidoglycan/LPS O-acetylase OafA/YrhL
MGRRAAYLRFLNSAWFLLVPVGIVVGSMSFVRPRTAGLIGHPMENICIALLIDRVVRIPGDAFGKVLNSRPFVFVGTLSYSLYLWQQPFCRRVETQNWSTAFPANLLLAGACALACRYLVEKPGLRLRQRFGRPADIQRRSL